MFEVKHEDQAFKAWSLQPRNAGDSRHCVVLMGRSGPLLANNNGSKAPIVCLNNGSKAPILHNTNGRWNLPFTRETLVSLVENKAPKVLYLCCGT